MENKHYNTLMRMSRTPTPRNAYTNNPQREEVLISAYWRLRSKYHINAIPSGASLIKSTYYGELALPVVRRWYYSRIGERK